MGCGFLKAPGILMKPLHPLCWRERGTAPSSLLPSPTKGEAQSLEAPSPCLMPPITAHPELRTHFLHIKAHLGRRVGRSGGEFSHT